MKIELQDISKYYGSLRANDHVSLTVHGGTIHGLLGENGAGKTTLMKILSGYQPPDAGVIFVDDRPVRFTSPEEAIAAGIGMLHQDPLDVPQMTVLDNFILGWHTRLLQPRRRGRRELLRQCERFGLRLDPDAPVGTLTVGERQQLELVRLLSLGVRTIILDEPTTGISAIQKERLFATLQQLANEGLSVILVSHKLDDIQALCSEATVLKQGQVTGHKRAPFDPDELVALMFGQCLTTFPRVSVSPGPPVLTVENGEVHGARLTVSGINLTVRAGEVIGVAGLEGSGQELMLRACAGIHRLRSGRLLIDGRDMTRAPYRRFLELGVAFVPAARLEEGLVSGLTIREHVCLRERADGFFIPWEAVERHSQTLIQEFNIIGRPETAVQALSGGNQQRTILALLPRRLRLAILEHPTRGLDMESTEWVWNRLLQRRKEGTAILFSSADLDELVEHSDRLLVFSGGVMSGPVDAATITCDALGHMIGGREQTNAPQASAPLPVVR
ncbi:MAG: ATP-binding cassette domain-containing protein [Chloroflexi bacterium]|nr:ATP-binding cassette domain-containing protein [Chloroflexota bacterium]